jgi:hypothetical protein
MLESLSSSETMDLTLNISTYAWRAMLQSRMAVVNWVWTHNLIQTTPKRRAPPDYKEKDSNEFKVAENVCPA